MLCIAGGASGVRFVTAASLLGNAAARAQAVKPRIWRNFMVFVSSNSGKKRIISRIQFVCMRVGMYRCKEVGKKERGRDRQGKGCKKGVLNQAFGVVLLVSQPSRDLQCLSWTSCAEQELCMVFAWTGALVHTLYINA